MVLAGFVCATVLQGGLPSTSVECVTNLTIEPWVVDTSRHRQALYFPTALQGGGHFLLLWTVPSAHPLSLGMADADFVLSHSPLGKVLLSPTVDCTPDLRPYLGLAHLPPGAQTGSQPQS